MLAKQIVWVMLSQQGMGDGGWGKGPIFQQENESIDQVTRKIFLIGGLQHFALSL